VNYAVFVISAGRPDAVGRMAPHLATLPKGTWAFWVVPRSDAGSYEAGGANVIIDPGSIVGARNLALDHAFANNVACVQLSDDLKRLRMLPKADIELGDALIHLEHALDSTGLALAGCSPTDNLYFAKDGVSTRKFVVGDLIMVRPTDLRFDEALRLKEDYDFTLQHWATYGGAARCDYIAPSFAHYTNAGGAVAARTADLEQETIAYLKAKWPGMIRDNPRRANEVLLTTPRRHR
jgi:hypothetical protein